MRLRWFVQGLAATTSDFAVILPVILRVFPMSQAKLAFVFLLLVAFDRTPVLLHAQAAPSTLTDSSTQSKKSASPEAVFADARHLSEQGSYDEAIAELQGLAARNLPPAGLSHELGTAYY